MTCITGSNFSYDLSINNLTIGENGDVTLTSGVYYFDDIVLEQGEQLILATAADVVIYLTNSFVAAQYSVLNSLGNPADLQFYSKGTTLEVSKSTEMYASVYALNANIEISQNDMLYGSIVGKFVVISQGACIHFDRSLSKVTRRQM